jgi:hypothetical protein
MLPPVRFTTSFQGMRIERPLEQTVTIHFTSANI